MQSAQHSLCPLRRSLTSSLPHAPLSERLLFLTSARGKLGQMKKFPGLGSHALPSVQPGSLLPLSHSVWFPSCGCNPHWAAFCSAFPRLLHLPEMTGLILCETALLRLLSHPGVLRQASFLRSQPRPRGTCAPLDSCPRPPLTPGRPVGGPITVSGSAFLLAGYTQL